MDLFVLDIPDLNQKEFQIALVDEPAIESDWVAFSKEIHNFKVKDKKKKIISGYAMIADLEIPRFDEKRGAYKVVFRKENIEKIVKNFFQNGLTTNTNEMHQTGKFAEGVYLWESFIIDSERGIKAPEGFKQEADGSWFISMKVENEEIWDKVLKGEFNGFSIEGRFLEKPDSFAVRLKKLINIDMTKEELKHKVLQYFGSEEAKEEKFVEAVLVDGTKVEVQPALEAGAAIVVYGEDGNPVPAPVGEHELESGEVVVVEEEGVVAEVRAPQVEEEAQEEAEEMNEESKEKAQVKKIIERIESEKIFEKIADLEKTVKFLKEENEALKADFTENKEGLNKEFKDLKEFNKQFMNEVLEEPVKEPVKEISHPFKKKEKKNMFLNKN